MRAVALVCAAFGILIAGCDSDSDQRTSVPSTPSGSATAEFTTVVPSNDCELLVKKADDLPSDMNADPQIKMSLKACSSVDEWMSALALHPGAMALTDRAELNLDSVRAACSMAPQTRVCVDAAARGLKF